MKLEALDLKPMPPTPAPLRSFPHESYAAAARTVLAATKLGPGFVLLTGAAGTGKTTLIHDLAEQLERDGYCVGQVANSRVDADDLLRLASFAFGLKAHSFSKAQLLSGLADQLRALCPAGKPAVLIIDEAQDLAPGALPELCQLVGLPGAKVPPVQILLSGRDRVWELLDRPDHAPIRQRILASCRLYPLPLEETRSYIAHSLEIAGWRGEPGISADALRLIHARTRGVPRLITLTLGHLLLHGRHFGARVLESQDVETVLAHLGKDHPELLSERPGPVPSSDHTSGQSSATADVLRLPARGEPIPSPEQRPSKTATALPGEPVPATRKRLAAWRWRWVLPALAAVAVVAYWLSLDEAGDGQDLTDRSTISESDGAEVGSLATVGSLERPPAELPQTPRELPQAPVIGASDPEIPRSPDAAEPEPEPRSVEPDPTIAGLEEAGGKPDELLDELLDGTAIGSDETPLVDAESQSTLGLAGASPDTPAQQPPEVGRLLEQAEAALSQNRLMAPAGDNAYGYYQEVLASDPENEQARAGLQRIVTRYRELAQQSLKKGNRAEARRYASRGLTLAPRDQQLLSVQRQASRSRARKPQRGAPQAAASEQQASQVPQVLDRIEAWLRSGRTDTSYFLDH